MGHDQGQTRQIHRVQWPYGLAEALAVDGAANGLTVPSVRLLLATPKAHAETACAVELGIQRLGQVLGLAVKNMPQRPSSRVNDPDAMLRTWLKLMSFALAQQDACLAQKVAGSPQCQRREGLFTVQGQTQAGYLVLWPTHWPQEVAPLLVWSLAQWSTLARLQDDEQMVQHIEAGQRQWQAHCQALRRQLPPGVNPARLLTAAHALNRPVHWLERDIVQLGHGRRARLLRSTLTDVTPSMGVTLARDKVRTSRLLRRAGLPVPQHAEVGDANATAAAAERLSWPVVVIPADQDIYSRTGHASADVSMMVPS